MNDTEPLAEGEYADLDTGTTVTRGGSVGTSYDENYYNVRAVLPTGGVDGRVLLEDEEIRQIAELAGYEVRDP